ncbi:MAG: dimethylsulfonioproprionate lyase family protein [Hyphomicrobiales bacterium]
MMTLHPVDQLLQEIERYLAGLDYCGKGDVQAGLARWRHGAPRPVTPAAVPPCAYLPQALAAIQDRALADAIASALPLLRWTTYSPYRREEIGAAFADGHAFASLIGEDAFRHADDFDLGLFIIAPGVLYPDHHHAAPELYAPLTGPHDWRFLPDEAWRQLPAGTPVWNAPWAPHATRTGDVPFLCIFCWTRDVSVPAQVIAGRG